MVNFKNFDTIAKPKSLQDFAFKSPNDCLLMSQITSGTYGFPNSSKYAFVLYGDIGAGKSTLAEMIPDLIEKTNIGMNDPFRETYDVFKGQNGVEFLNALDQKNNNNFSGAKTYYVINEADMLTKEASQQLKCLMDKYRKYAIFILTTNRFAAIDPPIVNRAHCFDFNNVPASAWFGSIRRILHEYKIQNASDELLAKLVQKAKGSGRLISDNLKQLIDDYYKRNPNELAMHIANGVPAFT
jgi:DNA polymerase III delta prime subunit